MEPKKVIKLKKKYAFILVIVLLGLFVVVMGASYAFFTSTVSGKEYVVYSGSLAVTYEKKTNVVNLQDTKPMTNTEGLATTPYSFDVKNTGTLREKYQIRIEQATTNTLPLEYVKISVYKNDIEYLKPTKLSDLNSNLVIVDNGLLQGMTENIPTSDNYKIRIWADINTPNDMMGKEFKGRIVIDAMQDVDDGYDVNTRPIITLAKDTNNNIHMNLLTGATFTDPGVEGIKDDKDALLVSNVTKTYEYYNGSTLTTVNSINTSNSGVYYITYSILDSEGLAGYATRVITVNPTATLPTITLNGPSSINQTQVDTYIEQGVTVGTNIQVGTLGEVKSNTPGVYTVRYIAIDENNNMNSVIRTVTVTKVNTYFEPILNGAYPVLTSNLVPVTLEEDGTVKKANIDKEWYSYRDKKWANAVVTRNSYETLDAYGKVNGATLSNSGYVSFDGVDDYIDLGLANYDFEDTITMAVKVKFNTIDKRQDFFGNWEGSGSGILLESNNQIQVWLHNGSYQKALATTLVNSTDTYLIIFTYDGTNIKLYMNNNLEATLPVTGDITVSQFAYMIGGNPRSNGIDSPGNIDVYQLAIFDRALTNQEISAMTTDIKITDSTGLLVYEDFTNQTYESDEVIPQDSIESEFVWIPKYSYQLFNTNGGDIELSNINIRFGTINTSDNVIGECTTPLTSGNVGNCDNGEYMTHPAFLALDTNGIWVGKFETGYDGATTSGQAATATNTNTVNTSKIIIKPNVYAWRNTSIENAFKNSYDYLRSDESHMIKNTEWAAVAYLTYSIYGTDTGTNRGRIRINNNSAYLTGYAAVTEPTCSWQSTSSECNLQGTSNEVTKPYNTDIGNLASTTHNITGIYDMVGGSMEPTSAIIKNTESFIFNYNKKYYDEYNPPLSNSDTTIKILGDATGEIVIYGYYYHGFSENYEINNYLLGGNYCKDGIATNIFSYSQHDSSYFYGTHSSFRIVLAP